MRRRFQHGRVFKRGKRRKVWVGRFYEPVVNSGKLSKKRRTIIIGLCSEVRLRTRKVCRWRDGKMVLR
jgi:hypothetical protein